MKVYLDDQRKAPKGWWQVKTAFGAISYLKSMQVTEISLDHDLGERSGTGYEVLCWIEKEVHLNGFPAPIIHVPMFRRGKRWNWRLRV